MTVLLLKRVRILSKLEITTHGESFLLSKCYKNSSAVGVSEYVCMSERVNQIANLPTFVPS